MGTKEKLVACIEQAARAPSSHNTQPWKFKIQESSDGKYSVRVFAEGSLRLTETDTDGRELCMSCGAAIETFIVAAAAKGYAVDIEYKALAEATSNEAIELAVLHIDEQPDPADIEGLAKLEPEIARRVTYRGDFSEAKISNSELEMLNHAVEENGCWLHVIPSERKALVADMIFDANDIQWRRAKWRTELAHWVRPRSAGDGLNIGMDILNLITRWAIRWFSFIGTGQGRTDRNLALAGPVLAVLGCNETNPKQWVKAGQALQRALLVASSQNIFVSYFNQPLQVREFSYLGVAEAINRPRGVPCMVFRAGKVNNPEHVRARLSPRRPVEEILL